MELIEIFREIKKVKFSLSFPLEPWVQHEVRLRQLLDFYFIFYLGAWILVLKSMLQLYTYFTLKYFERVR